MKNRLLLIFLTVLGGCFVASAQNEVSYSCDDGYTYKIDLQKGEAAIASCTSPILTSTTLSLPNSVEYNGVTYPCTELRDMAISGLSGITKVVFNQNLRVAKGRPVYNCSALTNITLNANLEKIENGLFYKCPSVSSFTVPAANTRFMVKDGTLYNAAGTVIYAITPSAVGATYTVPEGVKALGAWCLSGQTQMKEVVLTEGLEMIDNGCFAETGIGSLALPTTLRYIGDCICQDGYIGSITVAAGNPYLKVDADGFLLSADGKVCYASKHRTGACVVPEGVDSIRGGLCKRMYITSLKIPSTTVYIGPEAFERTIRLATVDFGTSLKGIGARAFWGSSAMSAVNLPETVETIGDEAFCDCQGVTSINVGKSLVSIGSYAFSGCQMVQTVTLPGTLRHWGERTFMSIAMLSEVILEEGIDAVGDQAFTQNYNLKKVSLPSTLRRIGDFAFSKCQYLTDIQMPAGVTHLGAYCLQDVPFSSGKLDLPNIVEIGDNALARLTNVTAISCGSSLRTIGVTGINGNTNMKTLTFKEGLESIGRAGLGNLPLKELVLPSTVKEVGYILFGSDNLCMESLTCRAMTPPSFIGEDTWGRELFGATALDFYDTVTLHVPSAALDSYKNDPIWGKFATILGDVASIDSITAEEEATVVGIYNLEGIRLEAPAKGFNILKMSDGTTRKVVVK